MESVDRLREWAGHFTGPYRSHERQLNEIADAIEAELAEGYVELPRDADGEHIHLGDMLEIDRGDRIDVGEATDIHLQGGKCAVSIGFEHDGGVTAYPEDYRHREPPTVEGVLRELLGEYIDLELDNAEPVIARYAAKLRLAEGGDAS